MVICDFVVKFDPKTETGEDITRKILHSIIINRIKAHKPAVLFMSGNSGEGKSETSLRLQEILLENQGLKLMDFKEDINVFTPLEYPKKIENLLFEKRLKKVNIVCVHEARELIKAQLWHSFLNRSVSDINAMSRSVKRLCVIIVSQFIRDISADIRYTLNYYCKISRPKGKRARLYIYIMWKDDRDLEKPKLRKRKLQGYLVYPNGSYRRFIPQYLEVRRPSKPIREWFENRDKESKAGIIRKKIEKLLKEMEQDIGVENKKIDAMLEWYLKNPESLTKIGKKIKGKWKVNPQFREMHDITIDEAKDFQDQLNNKIQDKVKERQKYELEAAKE